MYICVCKLYFAQCVFAYATLCLRMLLLALLLLKISPRQQVVDSLVHQHKMRMAAATATAGATVTPSTSSSMASSSGHVRIIPPSCFALLLAIEVVVVVIFIFQTLYLSCGSLSGSFSPFNSFHFNFLLISAVCHPAPCRVPISGISSAIPPPPSNACLQAKASNKTKQRQRQLQW
jgi:hypothetical protein